jgi:hypothetical protein
MCWHDCAGYNSNVKYRASKHKDLSSNPRIKKKKDFEIAHLNIIPGSRS